MSTSRKPIKRKILFSIGFNTNSPVKKVTITGHGPNKGSLTIRVDNLTMLAKGLISENSRIIRHNRLLSK